MGRGRGKWTLLEETRRYHNDTWDLIDAECRYPGGDTLVNTYRIGKDEKRIPYKVFRERKWGPSRRKGSDRPWVEGNVKGKGLKARSSQRRGDA